VANFGRMKNNPVKQGKVVSEYEKLRGVHKGNHQVKPQNAVSQADLAKEFGVSVDTLQRLKQISKLIPELQSAVSDGDIKYTVATSVFAKLSPDEQRNLLESIGEDKLKGTSQCNELCISLHQA